MLEKLKKEVFEANLSLVKCGLVMLTWGNVSGIDREKGLVVIKPSGVEYDKMTESDMVVTDLDGNIVEGTLNPSSDTPTHLVLYKAFPDIGGVVHTHSTYATVFSQACREIIPLGTTHADYFDRAVPVTRSLTDEEITHDYEKNTGKVIVETFERHKIDYSYCPAVLVSRHAPFCWGSSPKKAVENAYVLEQIALMAATEGLILPQKEILPMPKALLDKHFYRKHGKNAYYGQK